ncbi:hypothetical protein JCM31826_21700 [Thermaurantimonas aggregans]|uniref:DUF5723 domain-containing protein n=1 Tax=Thermaurantimonas aggregans TaxID=2173829 RepID=A0A401XNU3_9FLAO|nr:DUF5723 family protein [Thermaurantimonas aggregans]MCX8149275.1 DUF5723 family protein [Thermaurantimonas aggregans]GCD78688.1 hypothetical protein JCM31826_21700 [Thermaurantimonas aggregans]
MKRFLIALIILLSAGLYGQVPYSFYTFYPVAHTQIVNPAAPVNEKFTLGFINTGMMIENTPFRPMEFFLKTSNVNDVLRNSISGMDNSDYLNLDVRTDLLFLGFKIGKLYLSGGVYNQKSVLFGYPHNLLSLLYFGNAQFQNQNVNLLGNTIDITDYSAIHVGGQIKIKSLSIGGRIKLINGIQSFKTESTTAQVGFYDTAWTLSTDILIRSSGDFSDFADRMIDYRTHLTPGSTGNRGFAFDIAASYDFNDKLRVSAVMADIGSIKWNEQLKEYYSNGNVHFNGLNINLAEDEQVDSFDEIIDSINSALNIQERAGESYTTSLSARYSIFVDYKFFKNQRLSAFADLRKTSITNMLAFGAQYHMPITRWLSFMGSYTVINNNFSNFGAGFMFKFLGVQIYGVTDQINAILNPERLNAINFRMGINISFANPEYYKRKSSTKNELKN